MTELLSARSLIVLGDEIDMHLRRDAKGELGYTAKVRDSKISAADDAQSRYRLARAREKGTRSGRAIGRPRVSVSVERDIARLRKKGLGQLKIARQLGVGVSVVQRVIASRTG